MQVILENKVDMVDVPPSHLRYSRVAIALHWAIAAAILFEIGLGWRTEGPRGPSTYAVYQLHKSVGITILLLSFARLFWRLSNPPPALPETLTRMERALSHIVHVGFYVIMIGLPLSGWLLVSTSKTAVQTVLYGLIPWPSFPGSGVLTGAGRDSAFHLSKLAHHLLVDGIYILLALHVAGALKHHFIDKGPYFSRILPPSVKRLTAALLGLLMLGVMFIAVGKNVPLGTSNAVPAAQSAASSADAAASSAPASESATEEAAPTALATQQGDAAAKDQSADWAVDHATSSLGFSVNWTGRPVKGRFGKWNAAIHFDPDSLATSHVSVTIDMASARTGETEVDAALPEEDWFSVASHPKATFTASRFRKLSEGKYEAVGDLVLRGTRRSVTLPFTLAIKGDTATMSGSTTLDRLAFGVGQGQWTATDDVAGTVRVEIKLHATRK